MLTVVALLSILAMGAASVGWAFSRYNQLVRARHEVDNAAGQIQVELQARHDLVPALVECVRGHSGHERQIIEQVVEANSRALQVTGLNAETFGRETALSAALLGFQRVFAIGYPALKADHAFITLSNRLVEIEERLTRSRQFYNDAVFRLASGASEFPGTLFAEAAGVREVPPYFRSLDQAAEMPKFSLGSPESNMPVKS